MNAQAMRRPDTAVPVAIVGAGLLLLKALIIDFLLLLGGAGETGSGALMLASAAWFGGSGVAMYAAAAIRQRPRRGARLALIAVGAAILPELVICAIGC